MIAFLALVLALVTSAHAYEAELYCAHVALAEDAKAPKTRQFAPSRMVDVLHLKLDVTPDFRNRTVSGEATLTFTPIAKPLKTLRLDQVDLNVDRVTSDRDIQGYDLTDDALLITFTESVSPADTTTVTVVYDAEPKEGLYFRTRELGYAVGEEHIWTQGETHEARHWYPSYDYPNERFTSEVICRVPESMTVLSNGIEVSNEIGADGVRTSHWKQQQPHVNYLVALVAGPLKKVTGKYGDIPLALYTQPSDIEEAKHTFAGLDSMMAFFVNEIGVPYPWDQYNQVTIYDPHFGGMENTTLSTLNVGTLHRPELTENLRSSRGLVAHELAHQWFGDYVTCKDWSHIWLNEGFATYYDALHLRHVNGEDDFLYTMLKGAESIVGRKDRIPMVYRTYTHPNKVFTYRAYGKGRWVLHMLRSQLGEDLFRECVKAFLERNAFKSVVTEDLNRVIEELSGRSYDPFFDQWVYHARHPELKVRYSWDEAKKLAKVSVEQTQKVDRDVLMFRFPTSIRFKGEGWQVDHDIHVSERAHDFYVALGEKPRSVRFDPALTVLANVDFKKPKAMLYAQLEDSTDVLTRLIAAKALGDHKDKKTVERLQAALNEDPYYGVRERASVALGKIRTQPALDALIDSRHQADARVRNRVARDIGSFYHPKAEVASRAIVQSEKNPVVKRWALRSLSKYRGDQAKRAIADGLKTRTYRDTEAYYAQEAIAVLDDPSLTDDLVSFLSRKDQRLSHTWYGNTLVTLGKLNRNEKDKRRVRRFLAEQTNHPNQRVKSRAIRALGLLEDPKAIPIVQSFTGGGANKDAVQKAADAALKKLRAVNSVSVELKELTSEVMKLKEKNEKLQSDLGDLKKQIEAKERVEATEEKSETQGSD